MTPSRTNSPSDPTLAHDASSDDSPGDGEEVVVDALTGEVRTLTAAEIAAEEAEDRSSRVALAQGISPELFNDPYGEEQLETSKEEFEAMLVQFSGDFQEFREGEIVNAKVLRVTASSVILEFGFKSEGAVPLDEFKEAPEPGTEVEVLLESLEDDDGVVVLSKKKADFLRVWEKIREAHEADRPVKGTLVRKIKGGVTVDLMGVDAFLPGSQIALRRVPNIEDLIGEVYKFKIIKLNKRRRNIVVSRRVILEAERESKRGTLVKELLVGQVREGVVKNITDFGAFIDLGGLDGLLHITDMSWGRVGHPSEVVDIAQTIDVKVLDIDWNRERISLGLKQLLPYPWTDIDKKYPVGSRVRGRVVSITNYGAFVELEKGVEGLVHISEMSWTRNVRHPSKVVTIGNEIEAVVLKVDPKDEKISLGMKQIEEDPWLALPAKYPTGTRLTGAVRNLTSFGAFVEIESGIDGLVHVSDMSWTRRVEHPAEVVQKGQQLEVMVLDVDSENKRISLGMKQLQEDPWPAISERLAPKVEQDGKVARLQEKGFVVDLGDEIEGFVPASHSGVEEAEKLEEYYGAGDTVSLRVVESDAANRRIVLEITERPARKSQEQIEAARTAALAAAAAAEAAAKAGEEDDDAELIAATQAGKRNKPPREGGSRGSRDRGPAPTSPAIVVEAAVAEAAVAEASVVEASVGEAAPKQEE
ncbi:MAG: 30S ribosomal protein S1 [Gemmatimonadetes bacterium]|nr:30S ribosomal protein S1 [Gemmatimonadota bacterium]